MVKSRVAISFIIAIVVLALACFTVPTIIYKPRGLFLPGLTYHPYPPKKISDVQWLLYPPAAGSYSRLGQVSFQFFDPAGSTEKRSKMMEAMKKAAAAAGGNAIVKQELFSTAGYGRPSEGRWFGQGVVILTPKKD